MQLKRYGKSTGMGHPDCVSVPQAELEQLEAEADEHAGLPTSSALYIHAVNTIVELRKVRETLEAEVERLRRKDEALVTATCGLADDVVDLRAQRDELKAEVERLRSLVLRTVNDADMAAMPCKLWADLTREAKAKE